MASSGNPTTVAQLVFQLEAEKLYPDRIAEQQDYVAAALFTQSIQHLNDDDDMPGLAEGSDSKDEPTPRAQGGGSNYMYP